MDRLHCISLFAEVARQGSFAAAARRFAMSRSAVTKHIAWLEALFGARLLERSTKEVALTEAGRQVLAACEPMSERFDQIQENVRQSTLTCDGVVRIGAPAAFGRHHLLPVLLQVMDRHPGMEIEFHVDDAHDGAVSDRFDLAVRMLAHPSDARCIAFALMKAPVKLVAAPAYLARCGTPDSLADLARHECLVNTQRSPAGSWSFMERGREVSVRVKGRFRSCQGETLQQACRLERGLSLHPAYLLADDLAMGRLVEVLPHTPPVGLDVHVVHAGYDTLPQRVRAVVDGLRDWSRRPTGWASGRKAA